MKLDKKMLEYMFLNHIRFEGYVRAPWSHDTIGLDIDDMEKYIEDYTKFCADHYKLTVEQYEKWMDTNGTPQCGALTKRGKRCKRQSGRSHLRAQDWLELEGGLCSLHVDQEWHVKIKRMTKDIKILKQYK